MDAIFYVEVVAENVGNRAMMSHLCLCRSNYNEVLDNAIYMFCHA